MYDFASIFGVEIDLDLIISLILNTGNDVEPLRRWHDPTDRLSRSVLPNRTFYFFTFNHGMLDEQIVLDDGAKNICCPFDRNIITNDSGKLVTTGHDDAGLNACVVADPDISF